MGGEDGNSERDDPTPDRAFGKVRRDRGPAQDESNVGRDQGVGIRLPAEAQART